jgi:Ca-activated chloride channel family protein
MPMSTPPESPSAAPSPVPAPPATRGIRLLLAGAAVALLGLLVGPRLSASRRGEPGARPAVSPGGQCRAGQAPARSQRDFRRGRLTAALSGHKLLAGAPGEVYVSIDLTAAPADSGQRPAVDLALVIDRSGSMAGDKLVAAKQAARGIVGRLAEGDRVALVQYDNTAEVLVPLVRLDAEGRKRLAGAIDGIVERGGTNLHGGMVLGQQELLRATEPGRVNRVVLLSDGQANQGVTDSPTLGRAAAGAADRGVRLTTVGMGLDYNEDLMELLAENGRGRYYYVKDAASLEGVFAGELASMQATVASATELKLTPLCAGVEVLAVYGYETRAQGTSTLVPMVDLFGGDSRRLVAKLRVPAAAMGRADLLEVTLGYRDARDQRPGSAALVLGAEFSTEAQAVEMAVDREVMSHVVQMEAATVMRAAAQAYERGDRDGARRQLQDKERDMRNLAGKYALPQAKVEQALHDLPSFANEIYTASPASDEGKHSLKLRKAGAKAQMKAKW